jgi:enoyl-CoA hydratase/carnithine racemase
LSMTNDTRSVDGEPVSLSYAGDGVALVTIRRDQARNAIDPPTAALLESIVEKVEADPTIMVAVITGEGSTFCAGADLRQVAQGRLDDCFTRRGGFAGFVNAERAKPWIAAVNGPALAGGFEIVLACDLVIAAETSRFGLPEVKRGLIASAGGLYRLPRILPRAVAMELIATGKTMTAARAFEMGLVNKLSAVEDVVSEALALAAQICANSPLAVRESVRITRMASGFDDLVLRREAEVSQAILQKSDDYFEGARAFIEKREPIWRGS